MRIQQARYDIQLPHWCSRNSGERCRSERGARGIGAGAQADALRSRQALRLSRFALPAPRAASPRARNGRRDFPLRVGCKDAHSVDFVGATRRRRRGGGAARPDAAQYLRLVAVHDDGVRGDFAVTDGTQPPLLAFVFVEEQKGAKVERLDVVARRAARGDAENAEAQRTAQREDCIVKDVRGSESNCEHDSREM